MAGSPSVSFEMRELWGYSLHGKVYHSTFQHRSQKTCFENYSLLFGISISWKFLEEYAVIWDLLAHPPRRLLEYKLFIISSLITALPYLIKIKIRANCTSPFVLYIGTFNHCASLGDATSDLIWYHTRCPMVHYSIALTSKYQIEIMKAILPSQTSKFCQCNPTS